MKLGYLSPVLWAKVLKALVVYKLSPVTAEPENIDGSICTFIIEIRVYTQREPRER
jgi:hypothetical protein